MDTRENSSSFVYLNKVDGGVVSCHGPVGEDQQLHGRQVEREQTGSLGRIFPQRLSPLQVYIGVLLLQVVEQLLDLCRLEHRVGFFQLVNLFVEVIFTLQCLKMLVFKQLKIVTECYFERVVLELDVNLLDKEQNVGVDDVEIGAPFPVQNPQPLDDAKQVIGQNVVHVQLVGEVELEQRQRDHDRRVVFVDEALDLAAELLGQRIRMHFLRHATLQLHHLPTQAIDIHDEIGHEDLPLVAVDADIEGGEAEEQRVPLECGLDLDALGEQESPGLLQSFFRETAGLLDRQTFAMVDERPQARVHPHLLE